MSRSTNKPEQAILSRFDIKADNFPDDVQAWLLSFPRSLYRTSKEIQEELEKITGRELNRPNRHLNNALMATTSLVHGFEYEREDSTSYALAITTRSGQRPTPSQTIFEAVNAWMRWWIDSLTAKHPDARRRLREMWQDARDSTSLPRWEQKTLRELLRQADGNHNFVTRAIPSLVAALLHGKQSQIEDKTVHWYKVQDGGSKRLGLVGMAENRPRYGEFKELKGFNRKKADENGHGYWAFKLDFDLQYLSGREQPYLSMKVHVQRYADEPLTQGNFGRNASLLIGAHCFRLDRISADSTLVKLPIRKTKDDGWVWAHALPELIHAMRIAPFAVPDAIVTGNPKDHWDAAAGDTYYLIHAEGYSYGDDGHSLEAGVSMFDMDALQDVVHDLLPFLERNGVITADSWQAPAKGNRPNALKTYASWKHLTAKTRTVKPEHEANRREFQQLIAAALLRATNGEPLHLLPFVYSEHMDEAIRFSLREALMLNPDDDWPENVVYHEPFIITNPTLLTALDKKADRATAHAERVALWQAYLEELALPEKGLRLAVVELLKTTESKKEMKGEFGTRSVIRQVMESADCAVQMLITVPMVDDNGTVRFKKGGAAHDVRIGFDRPMQAARDALMRHAGILLGRPTEIFELLGMPPIDVVGIYFKQTQSGIRFPIAVRLTHDGQTLVRFPHQSTWIPYLAAAPRLGKLFTSQWKHLSLKKKGSPKLKDKSALYCKNDRLRYFLTDLLLELDTPTMIIVEADKWRERRSDEEIWTQLHETNLAQMKDVLRLGKLSYVRQSPKFEHVVGIVRMQSNNDTLQYVTNTLHDFFSLFGATEQVGGLLRYYSIGERLENAKGQRQPMVREKASMLNDKASGIVFKHPQVVEFVPFYVKFGYDELLLARAAHLLRHLPHWKIGTPVLPYPLHLAKTLIEDQLCILAMDD